MTQNSESSEDLRVRRTRKMLQEALINLTVEKGFSDITVGDIAERAMVNRSTFYRHYLDKYDLLRQYTDDAYALTSEDELRAEKMEEMEYAPSGLVKLLLHIQERADFYQVMLGPKGDPGFTEVFRKNIEKRFRYLFKVGHVDQADNPPPVPLRISYVSYAGIGAILWWLENGQPCTVEQLAHWLSHLCTTAAGLSFRPESPLDGG